MAVSEEYLDYVLEQLECVGSVAPQRMFGGVGLYLDGLFFALIADNILRFKVDESNKKKFESRGMEAFHPYRHKSTTMQYYEVPIEVLEDQEILRIWAEKALAVASRKKKKL